MQSPLKDVLADALPVVCVVAGSSLLVILIVAWLVRDIAVRAIEKAAPDQIAAVVSALTGLVSPFRWIWPWSRGARMHRRKEDNDRNSDPSTGDES